jgi:hypothetical protein
MGFLTGFVGGMAGAYNDDRDAEKLDARKKQLAEYESQLQMNRMVMQETLRERLKQAEMKAKRDQDVADGKTIQEGSEAKRVERAQGIINADTGLNYSPEEVKKIIADPTWTQNYGARHDTETGKPTEWTEGGLINQRTSLTPSTDRTAYQEQMDLSNAAGGIGRTDMQDKYRATADTERRFAGDEAKTAATEKAETRKVEELRIKEKDVDNKAKAAESRTQAILDAAEIRASKTATAKEKADATLNLNTSVTTQANLIKTKAEQIQMLDAKNPDDAKKIADLRASIKEAEDIQALAQKALKGTLEDGNFKRDAKRDGKPKPEVSKGITKAEYDKLPSGASFTAPDGSRRIKP